MNDDAGWAIYSLLLGWTLAPVVLALILVAALTVWRYFAPYPPFPESNLQPPPLPPWPPKPPLTDAELACRMRQARIMRQKLKRGLV
jgi:hypothetical protein